MQILWVALKSDNIQFLQNPRMAESVYWADPGWTLVPKVALSLLFSAGQGEKIINEVFWCEIRAGRDPSPVTVTGKTDLAGGY